MKFHLSSILSILSQSFHKYWFMFAPTLLFLYLVFTPSSFLITSFIISLLFMICAVTLSLKESVYFAIFCTILLPTGMAGNIIFKTYFFGVPFHPSDIMIALMAIIYLKELLLKRTALIFNSMSLSIVAFVASVTISGLYSKMFLQHTTWNIIRDFRGIYTLLLFLPFVCLFISDHEKKKVLHFIGCSYLLFSLFMLVLFFLDSNISLKQAQALILDNSERLYFHNHSLSLIVIPTMSLLWNHRPQLLYFFYTITGIALILAHARMLLLLNCVAMIIVFLFIYKNQSVQKSDLSQNKLSHIIKAGSFAFLTIILMGIFLRFVCTEFFNEKFMKFQQRVTVATSNIQDDSSLKGRWLVTVSSIEQITKKPLFGYGIGSQISVPWAKQSRNAYLENEGILPSIDNTYITVAYKMGLFGLALLILVIIIFAKNIFIFFQRRPPPYAYGISIGLILLLVDNLFQSVFINYRIVWILLLSITFIVPSLKPKHLV